MDQQVRDEHLDQAAPHSVGHNTSQITAMFMIYGMVGSSMSFSLHLSHLMGPTCAIAVHGASSVTVEGMTQVEDWASKGQNTTSLTPVLTLLMHAEAARKNVLSASTMLSTATKRDRNEVVIV